MMGKVVQEVLTGVLWNGTGYQLEDSDVNNPNSDDDKAVTKDVSLH